MEAWNAALAKDGIMPVKHWDDPPKGSTSADGWIVALAVPTEGPGHFLRLDGDIWSHKMATLAPQTCDLTGAPIKRDDILAVNLCNYVVRGFYWVPAGIVIG